MKTFRVSIKSLVMASHPCNWRVSIFFSSVAADFALRLGPDIGKASKQIRKFNMKRLGFIIQQANQITNTKTQTTSTDDTQIPWPDLRFAKGNNSEAKPGKGPEPKQKTPTQKTTRFVFDTGGGPTASSKTCTLKLYCHCQRPSKRCEKRCNSRSGVAKFMFFGDLYTAAASSNFSHMRFSKHP